MCIRDRDLHFSFWDLKLFFLLWSKSEHHSKFNRGTQILRLGSNRICSAGLQHIFNYKHTDFSCVNFLDEFSSSSLPQHLMFLHVPSSLLLTSLLLTSLHFSSLSFWVMHSNVLLTSPHFFSLPPHFSSLLPVPAPVQTVPVVLLTIHLIYGLLTRHIEQWGPAKLRSAPFMAKFSVGPTMRRW